MLSAREPLHGTTSATRPSAIPSPPFDVLSGIRRVYACLGKPRRSLKSLRPCCKDSPRLSVTLRKKAESRAKCPSGIKLGRESRLADWPCAARGGCESVLSAEVVEALDVDDREP